MATIINPADQDKMKSVKLLVLSAQPVFYNTTTQFSISTKTNSKDSPRVTRGRQSCAPYTASHALCPSIKPTNKQNYTHQVPGILKNRQNGKNPVSSVSKAHNRRVSGPRDPYVT